MIYYNLKSIFKLMFVQFSKKIVVKYEMVIKVLLVEIDATALLIAMLKNTQKA